MDSKNEERARLEESFGACVDPAYVGEAEQEIQPHTLLELASSNTNIFCKLASLAQPMPRLSHTMYVDFTLIWLVDADGALWLALEEIRVPDQANITHPIPRNMPKGKEFRSNKLGHPALVKGQKARIGGELSYDPNSGRWIINNKSGRYGVNQNRTKAQLEHAAEMFRSHGLEVEAEFY